jgi:hypothetical protein
MERSQPAKAPKAGRKAKAAKANPKLADQTRKKLGKHYASKYQTRRRG